MDVGLLEVEGHLWAGVSTSLWQLLRVGEVRTSTNLPAMVEHSLQWLWRARFSSPRFAYVARRALARRNPRRTRTCAPQHGRGLLRWGRGGPRQWLEERM